MQDRPNNLADLVSHRPDRLVVTTQLGQESPKNRLEVTALGAHGGVSHLAEHAANIAVAFGAAAGIVLTRRFLGSRADSHPRSQLSARREGCGGWPDFSHDRLCCLGADARHFY